MPPKSCLGVLIALLLTACEPRVQALQLDSVTEERCQAVATTGDAYRACLEAGPERFARRA